MPTAILISGETRTFKWCYDNLRHYVFGRIPDLYFFVSVADDAQAKDMNRLCEHFKNVFIEVVKQPDIPEPAVPPYSIAGYAPSSPPQAILRQFWHLARVWDFFQSVTGPIPEYVVRCRPDLFFRKLDFATHPYCALAPYWGGYGGVNDRFAIMPYALSRDYFRTFHRIEKFMAEGAPLHPETLLALSLGGAYRRTLNAEFCTVRMPNAKGEMTLVEPDHRPGDLIDYLADRQ